MKSDEEFSDSTSEQSNVYKCKGVDKLNLLTPFLKLKTGLIALTV